MIFLSYKSIVLTNICQECRFCRESSFEIQLFVQITSPISVQTKHFLGVTQYLKPKQEETSRTGSERDAWSRDPGAVCQHVCSHRHGQPQSLIESRKGLHSGICRAREDPSLFSWAWQSRSHQCWWGFTKFFYLTLVFLWRGREGRRMRKGDFCLTWGEGAIGDPGSGCIWETLVIDQSFFCLMGTEKTFTWNMKSVDYQSSSLTSWGVGSVDSKPDCLYIFLGSTIAALGKSLRLHA